MDIAGCSPNSVACDGEAEGACVAIDHLGLCSVLPGLAGAMATCEVGNDDGLTEVEAGALGVDSSEADGQRRPWCGGCNRARRICICDSLPPGAPLQTRTRVALLVHPKEVRRPLGTAPLLRLCLSNLVVHVADRFPEPEDDRELHMELHEGGHRCILVCPGANAEVLRPSRSHEQADDQQSPATLIFVDGRWSQAKTMVNRSRWMQQLPRAVICPSEQSGYVFRKQPVQGCLSTLEAVAEALLALEGPRGPELKQALIAPFSTMVQLQCPFIPDLRDKNAALALPRCGQGEAELFDRDAALRSLKSRGVGEDALAVAGKAKPGGGKACGVHCIVRWGQRSVDSREVVVTQIMCGPAEDAKLHAANISCGKARGSKFWVLPIAKVPVGARVESGVL